MSLLLATLLGKIDSKNPILSKHANKGGLLNKLMRKLFNVSNKQSREYYRRLKNYDR